MPSLVPSWAPDSELDSEAIRAMVSPCPLPACTAPRLEEEDVVSATSWTWDSYTSPQVWCKCCKSWLQSCLPFKAHFVNFGVVCSEVERAVLGDTV